MPYRVLFAEDAERDIEDLYRFIASRDGAETAEGILTEFESARAELEHFPARGNIPKDRELHHNPWRMIYRMMGTDVIVHCVAQTARHAELSEAKVHPLTAGISYRSASDMRLLQNHPTNPRRSRSRTLKHQCFSVVRTVLETPAATRPSTACSASSNVTAAARRTVCR
ncbi:plasmid stabilization system protein ParE [Rhizobium leguminosarum]|nr:plasmid stabilization system protein ParE [Rhizobium leguminosarum]